MQFKKDLFRVLSSNVINLLIGLINGFLIPAFLSLDQYASLKTFTLYISYVGILHFGFIDGIYIKYGGKHKEEIEKGKLKGEHKFLVLFQLTVTVVSGGLGLLLDDLILIAFSIAILPINVQTLFKFLYQALGDFNIYSKIMVLTPNILLISNLFIIFIFKINNFWPFVIGNIIAYFIVFIGLEVYFLKKYKGIAPIIEFKEIWGHFKIGIFVMVGNLSSMLFYTSDQWFVKFTLSKTDFAYYSFAISMITVINILINSVTMTFYPYLARGKNDEQLKLIKLYLLFIGTLSSGGYFVFEFIVYSFMDKFIPSLDVITILFASYPAMIIIQALYVNLYKAKKLEKVYLYTVVKMLLISIVLNTIAILISKNNSSIALATMISFYIWYLYSAKDFSMLNHRKKEVAYLGIFLTLYFTCTFYLNGLLGMFIYFFMILILTNIFYYKEVKMFIKAIVKRDSVIK